MMKNLLGDDEPDPRRESKPTKRTSSSSVLSVFDSTDQDDPDSSEEFVISEGEPESIADSVRRSGMAWSAGVAFFAAVVFMLVIGWGADVMLGTRPWGIVGGIVLGSVIGFIQFFRITSQIFKK